MSTIFRLINKYKIVPILKSNPGIHIQNEFIARLSSDPTTDDHAAIGLRFGDLCTRQWLAQRSDASQPGAGRQEVARLMGFDNRLSAFGACAKSRGRSADSPLDGEACLREHLLEESLGREDLRARFAEPEQGMIRGCHFTAIGIRQGASLGDDRADLFHRHDGAFRSD